MATSLYTTFDGARFTSAQSADVGGPPRVDWYRTPPPIRTPLDLGYTVLNRWDADIVGAGGFSVTRRWRDARCGPLAGIVGRMPSDIGARFAVATQHRSLVVRSVAQRRSSPCTMPAETMSLWRSHGRSRGSAARGSARRASIAGASWRADARFPSSESAWRW